MVDMPEMFFHGNLSWELLKDNGKPPPAGDEKIIKCISEIQNVIQCEHELAHI